MLWAVVLRQGPGASEKLHPRRTTLGWDALLPRNRLPEPGGLGGVGRAGGVRRLLGRVHGGFAPACVLLAPGELSQSKPTKKW